LVVLGVVLAGCGFAADACDGRWHAPSSAWPAQLAFTRDLGYQGQFRILWVGDPSVLPLDPAPVEGGLSYTLTRDGPGDSRELQRGPVTSADDQVRDAIAAAVAGRTALLGRILAPMGVRYVVLPLRDGPGGVAGRPLPAVDSALSNQLDLARLGSDPSLELYQNEAWYPGEALVPHGPVPARPADPARAAAAVDLSGRASVGASAAGPGTVLWFEAFNSGWSAHAGGRALSHQPAFGVTNQFQLPTHAAVTISPSGTTRRDVLAAAEVVLWLLALAWWARGRRRSAAREERDARRVAARIAREERRRGLEDPLESEVEFWEQG